MLLNAHSYQLYNNKKLTRSLMVTVHSTWFVFLVIAFCFKRFSLTFPESANCFYGSIDLFLLDVKPFSLVETCCAQSFLIFPCFLEPISFSSGYCLSLFGVSSIRAVGIPLLCGISVGGQCSLFVLI